MKVILETPRVHQIQYLRFIFIFIKTKDHSPQAGVTLANDGRSGPIKVSLPQNTPIEVPVTS